MFLLASASSVADRRLSGPSAHPWWLEVTSDCQCDSWMASLSEVGWVGSRLGTELQLIQVEPDPLKLSASACHPHLALVKWQLEGSRTPCLWPTQSESPPRPSSKSSICLLLITSFTPFHSVAPECLLTQAQAQGVPALAQAPSFVQEVSELVVLNLMVKVQPSV